MANSILETPIEYLKGVGTQRADILKKELHIFTYGDLLSHYPFRYIDRTKFYTVSEISESLQYVQLRGRIVHYEVIGEKRGKRLVAKFRDATGILELVWFQSYQWWSNNLKLNEEYVVFGKPSEFNGKFNMVHPELDLVSELAITLNSNMQAMYNTSEKMKARGLDSRAIRKMQQTLVALISNSISEILPESLLVSLRMLNREEAIKNIHTPANPELLKRAQNRIKFEELFFIQLRLLKLKINRNANVRGFSFLKVGDYFNDFYKNNLPFELTGAQKKVMKEIRADMGSGKQMNRLLQGDVGSGKTMVALMCMLIALDNGFQSCLMAPTEILANQHFDSLKKLLVGTSVNIDLLTGSSKTKQRRALHENLQNGNLHILIGTHAVLEDVVQFQNLGLVVIDEQHRFGVEQRSKLWNKNTQLPHVLVMTATPIPRTLAMTLYGDLDISVIDEMPPGRKPIITSHRYDSARIAVFNFMREQIKLGKQVYVVYPLIKESEKMDYKDLMDGFESISRAFPKPEFQISIVHGKMKSADKDYEMQRFVRNETQIMVATTVIEVGVNVPNASIMVIESAERFGLSQLHQLRGRVGRGADQSYCILMTSYKLGEDTKIRLETMVRTTDGFEIADVDLKLRGPGDLQGTQQSGIVDLKLADLSKDAQIVQLAREAALKILEQDPNLQSSEYHAMVQHLNSLNKSNVNWSRIS
ncbi:MAG: ATP-dependent DNA helicase RecG [Bacteroidetes bacterium]|nr:ATP-dependent DNA helicase RecG [Bacteroidota bacterium]